jgi:RHS repeat-associated protein
MTSGNRNFSFGLPILNLPGRGLDVSLSLVYNSLLWNKSTSGSTTYLTYDVDSGWPAPGFRLGFGQIEDQGSNGFTLTDPDGTRHALAYSSANNYDTKDGTFIHYNGGAGTGTLFYPNGTQVTYGAGGGGQRIYPTRITDRNGDYISIAYAGTGGAGPKISDITDTLERHVTFQYDSTSGDLVSITSPGLGTDDELEVMHFFYKSTDINLNQSNMFSGVTPVFPPNNTAHVLEYVYLSSSSDGTSPHIGYRFDYSPYGMIYQTTQYRGMTIGSSSVTSNGTLATQTTYDYPTTPSGLTDAPTYSQRTEEWAGRTTGGSAPSYLFSTITGSGETVSKITAPDLTVSETHSIVHPGYWDDGLVTDTYIQYGSTPTVLTHTKMDWQLDSNSANPRVYQVRTTDVPASLTKATVLSYTSYNNVSVVSDRAFTTDNSVSSPELRRTETNYVTSSSYINRHLLQLPTNVKVFASGSSSPASLVEYAYDDYGSAHAYLTGRSSLVMHDAAFDPFGGSYDSTTDARGNVTSVTTYTDAATPSGSITHATKYDIAGNVTSAQVDCCQLKTIDYSSDYKYAYPTSVTSGSPSGLHLTTSATYDLHTGLPATSTDENGQVTTNYYNADSLRLNHIQNPSGAGSTYFYYGDGLISDSASHYHYWVNVSTQLNSTDWVDIYRFYTGRGEVAQTFYDGTGSGPWSSQVTRYDAMGRVVLTTNPFSTGGYGGGLHVAAGDPVTVPSYDHLGRVTTLTMPSGDATNPTTAQVSTSYDGVFTTVTDQALKVRRQKVDEFGRVIRLDEPSSSGLGTTGSPNQATSYAYDVLNNPVKITQGAQSRYFKYDSLSRLIRERQVEQTVNSSYDVSDSLTGNGSWTRKIDYNSFGQVSHVYDARGVQTDFTYDDLNRLQQIEYSDATPDAHYYYDSQTLPAGHPSYSPSNSNGRLIAMTYGGGATGNYFNYDPNGRVTSQWQVTGLTPTTYALSYAYNYAGMLSSETYPSGRVLSYAYGYGGRLSSVSDGTTTFANSFTYAPSGGLTSETWGNTSVHTISYNRALQASQVKLSVNGSEKQRYDYLYGEVTPSSGSVDTSRNTGQIGRVDGTINGAGTKEWDQRFAYDELGRLSTAAEYQQGTGSTPTWKAKYTYDQYGNRQQSGSTDNAGIAFVPVTSSDINAGSNRFISTGSTPVTYDNSGNITQDMKFRMSGSLGMKYEYDANGRQATAKLSDDTTLQTSVYDCLGQRVQTSAGALTRTMVYDIFGQDVADYSYVGNGLERENIYRAGQLLATQEFPTTQNVVWTNATGVYVTGNSITKSGTTGWGYSGAVSTQAIASGDGYAEFSADSLDYGMYGLSHDNPDLNYTGIDYAIYTERAEGKVFVYENGTSRGQVGTWTSGDRFRVAVEGGVVKYKKNGTVMYTSAVAPTTYPLFVDTSLYNGDTLSNVTISGDFTGTAGVRYVLQDVQGSTRAVLNNNGSSSTIVARHDYLPFGEELGSGTGLRSGTQGYGVADTNRQKYGMTERDDATGLDHTSWRKYENASGRWTSPDPYSSSMTITSPQSFNRYAYVQNDPVNFVDPSGLFLARPTPPSPDYPWDNWLFWRYMFWEPGGGGPGGGDPGGGGPGGGPARGPQNPLTDPSVSFVNPCAGSKPSQLDYSRVRKYNDGGRQSAEDHIRWRHINPVNGNRASQYEDVHNRNAGTSEIFETVKKFNAVTFSSPDTVQTLTNGFSPVIIGYVFVKTIRPAEIEGRTSLGIDRQTKSPTLSNSLFVGADCKTVDTSHPGKAHVV